MQVHTLTLAAIGPFRDRQEIDFTRLSAGGLFLLDGPTGAGKSTLIDAIVFALYGQVAGTYSSKHRLVSDHRKPDTEPFVDLVFETGRGIYRVRRTPEFQRPKKRGEGMATQQASVKLWKATSVDGLRGDPVSTRVGEADAEILDALGLSREQFVKTVVLPQGEFARFLQSQSEERRDILQRIFGTEHFELVQDELRRRRSAAREACRTADQSLQAAVESFAETAEVADSVAASLTAMTDGVLTATVDTRDDAEAALTKRIRGLVDELDAAHAELTLRRDRAATERAAAQRRLEQLQDQRARRDRLREARAERARLDAELDDHRALRTQLDAARRAATCRAHVQALDDVTRRLEAEEQRVQDLRATSDIPTGVGHDAGPEAVRSVHRELRDTIVSLGDLNEVETALPQRRDELRTLERDQAKLTENLQAFEARLADLPGEIHTVQSELDTAREAAYGRTTLDHERAELTALQQVHQEWLAVTREQAAAQARQREALQALTAASERESDLRQRYLAGIAAEIADDLVEGSPCRVCGSTEHPDPARRAPGDVVRADVDEAEHIRRERATEYESAQQAVAEVTARVSALEGRLDGRSAEQLAERLAEVDEAIAEAQAADRRATQLADRLDQLQQERERTRLDRGTLKDDLAGVEARIRTVSEAIDADEARVAAQRHGYPSISARIDTLQRQAHAAEQLATALAEADRLAHDRATRERELDDAVSAAGFGSRDEAIAALLPAERIEQLDAQVTEWQRRSHEVDGRLADPDLAGVDVEADIDVDGAQAVLDAREAEYTSLLEGAASSDDRRTRARRASSKVVRELAQRRSTFDESAAVIRMADLANADSPDNLRRLPLATYVLQRVFDRVVDAANGRLVEMSSGRYALESYDGTQPRARKTGLGLRVVDAHTGQCRDTSTLSGGETFYVSLSLALGLADIVTAQSGGIRMETLFVDEGFGSLDADTLDTVMAALAELRSGGRTVGVVSHVDELKRRIPERIEVRRAEAGGPSSVTVVA